MSTRALLIAVLVALHGSGAAAQEGRFVPAPRLFDNLFRSGVRALRPSRTPPAAALRERATNRVCQGCEARPGAVHLIADSPLLNDAFLARHQYQSNGGEFGDNAAVADFWYDGVHRRISTRSAAFYEVDDPADVRLGRAPGRYPNAPDFDALLGDGTTVGHVGFVGWGPNGFGSYFAAVQGSVRTGVTGYLDLTTAPGHAGVTRTGSRFEAQDLIRHVRLHPSGQFEIGYETAPAATPDPLLVVRGGGDMESLRTGTLTVRERLETSGLTVRGGGGNVPYACALRTATVEGRSAHVACEPGRLAIGGGGTCARGELRGSRPLPAGELPVGWEVTCSREGAQTVHAICCAR